MADELKRVGLLFTQEGAIDFKKTLQEVSIEMNKNYNQFKLTQAQWDSSTKSTEKLRVEQEYLKNAYEIQADKVSILKMQLSDLENAENKNTTAIKKKRNELTSAEVKLETYNKRLKEIDNQLKNTGKSIEEWGENVKKSGEKIEKAGKKVSAFSIASASALVACAKSAIDFETAFTGVEKTVDGTAEQMAELKQGIRDMAKEIPSSTTEISAVAEAAGQLGIKTENILDFSKAMIDLGNSTNLSADEAASSLAKFANIMGMSQSEFDRLGSSIVDLGNHFATTEADIVEMSMRLAGAGKQVGLSEGQVLGLATALSSVGIEAEMGGSAISKTMVKMQNAVEQGGTKLNDVLSKTGMTLRELELMSANDSKGFKDMAQSIGMTSTEVKQLITAGTNLEDFAKISGMTAEEFKKAWKEDAAGAISAFIKGLGDAENKGESAITLLSEMGLTEVRLRDSLLRAANAGELFTDAIETGTKAWEDNTALTNEANKRYETLASQIQKAINKLKDIAIIIGEKLMPYIQKAIDGFGKWIEKFQSLSDEEVDMIVKLGLIVAAIGPVITIIGKLTSTIGGAGKAVGTVVQAFGVMEGKITSTSGVVNNLAKVFSAIASPMGLAVIAIGGVATALWMLGQRTDENVKKMTEQIEAVKKQEDALNQLKDAQKEYLNANLSEIDNVSKLKDELSELVDENGKVKDGYKGRVAFILGELNDALGTEFTMTDDVINKYKELTKSIDETIAKKKANIILNSMEEGYTNALKSRSDAIKNLAELEKNYSSNKQAIMDKEAEKLELMKKKQDIFTLSRINRLNSEIQTLQENVNAYDEQKEKIIEYNTQIADYETVATTIKEGNIEKIEELNQRFTNSYEKRKDDTIASLLEQLDYEIINLQTQKEAYEKNQNEVTENQIKKSQERLEELAKELQNRTSTVEDIGVDEIEAWKTLANKSYDTYYDTISKMPPELSKKIQEMTGVTAERTPELVEKTSQMSQKVLDEIEKNPEFRKTAIDNLKGMLQGLEDEELRNLLQEAGVEDVDRVIQGIKDGNLAEDEGTNILKKLHEGLNNKSWLEGLWSTARGIASKLSGLLSVKAEVNGNTSKLPGHRSGLDYVPKDDYVARLHKGERVLTKEENKEYTQEKKGSTYNSKNAKYSFSMNVYCQKLNEEELDKIFNYMNRRFGSEY